MTPNPVPSSSASESPGLGAIKRAAWSLVSIGLFVPGLLVHALGGPTPRVSFHAMRRLYGPTHGLLNRLALALARWRRPVGALVPVSGFLGTITPAQIQSLVQRIDLEGYAVFEQMLPETMCDALLEFARTTPCRAMGEKDAGIYAEADARALRYDFPEQSIVACPEACQVAFDGTLAAIAAAYFRCSPVYDFTAMWWTTGSGEKNYSTAAQEFHFDMDRFVFLKFFVYLTDVSLESGPHVFVAGSHKNKPAGLSDPVRFTDGQVESAYPPDAIRRICGPRGTIFAADTSGIHKGLPVISGHRLALQVEFTLDKFGQTYPGPVLSETVLGQAGIPLPLDPRIYPDCEVRRDA